MRIIFRPQFWFDIDEGVAYLAEKASPEVARSWHAEILTTVNRLERQPDLGRPRNDLNPPVIRSLNIRRYPRYLLFYRWSGDTLEILRIKQGMMDLPRLFAGNKPEK